MLGNSYQSIFLPAPAFRPIIMNILADLKERFRACLGSMTDDPEHLLGMIRPTQNPRFGDYQANFAMPLEKQLKRPAAEIAQDIIDQVDLADLCETPEVAGKGFINLRLRTSWITEQLERARNDPRMAVAPTLSPKTYVVDFSSPNVAKPMHVGHIRSTVIGDAISRLLDFRGHRVIRDNHLGDWGTQFGMILYGFEHFVNTAAYEQDPVAELSRLYRLIRQIMDYQNAVQRIPQLTGELAQEATALDTRRREIAQLSETEQKSELKKANKALRRAEAHHGEREKQLAGLRELVRRVEADTALHELAQRHPEIEKSALLATARLHAGDEASLARWHEFLPQCRHEMQRIYDRLNIQFDVELGESFYHDRLAPVVDTLLEKGWARESEGAICVFLDGFDAPMIIRKRDGAFLYATTDLATIQYRMEMWDPQAILYVVDFRQGEHFDKMFAAARLMGYDKVELKHVSFGTVLGEDGKPFKTRSGDTVGLESLLDDAVAAALAVVTQNDSQKETPDFTPEEREQIAQVIGHAAIKYADLSQNRDTDYKFTLEKMVAMQGNTATYMQYSYARIRNIFARGSVDQAAIRQDADFPIVLEATVERQLGLRLLRFEQAIDDALEDYRPNALTDYLFELAKHFSEFYNECPVLKAQDPGTRGSRLVLCDLVGRTIFQGLELLGIDVVDRM